MKNGNLYQKVKSAKKDDRVAWAKYYEMLWAMEKELEEATRPIKEKYEPILKILKKEAYEKGGKVWDIAGMYHDCGRFFAPNITDIIAVFLTYIEGEKYIPYRNWKNNEINENSIIIKESVNNQYDKIDYSTLDKLYKNGDLIRLNSGFSNMVDFYNNVGEANYSFGEFSYLHEFVNRLIQYRIENDKKNVNEITMDDLYSFMCNFILTHPDLAQKNKDKREQMLMRESEEDKLMLECKKLEKRLK